MLYLCRYADALIDSTREFPQCGIRRSSMLRKQSTEKSVVVLALDTGVPWCDIADIAEMVSEPVLLLTSELRISKANDVFDRTLQVNNAVTEGPLNYERGSGQMEHSGFAYGCALSAAGAGELHRFSSFARLSQRWKKAFLLSSQRLTNNTNYIVLTFKQIRNES
ncbi:MAG: hypothetical protein JWO95_268, partial [Verrucomicrobiales bacterium]|nr:hypothetical protein [Verrucomicrobiales bacterium]